ncbi:MAG: tryptophan 2,3-dioxygenase family protein [Anaerolineae bacterium]
MPQSDHKGLNYAEYLRLEDILGAQHMQSDEPDELQFIIIHQVHELWFKLALNYLERVRDALQGDRIAEAVRLLGQVTLVFDNTLTTVEQLHTLPPAAFQRFRSLLAPGSGLQSYQFREIELLCGLRDEQYVDWIRRQLGKAGYWGRIAFRLDEPSVYDAFLALLARRGMEDVVDLYATPDSQPDLYLLVEALSALEHRILAWRYSHIQLVERTIGSQAVGTGGTLNDYLQATLRLRLFPCLWEARAELTHRTTGGTNERDR